MTLFISIPSLLGIDPSFDMHKKYLEQLCQDFESKVKNMITESIAEHKAAETENVVYVEVAQHMLFCKRKIAAVCRRESTLKVQSEAWSPYIFLRRASGRTFLPICHSWTCIGFWETAHLPLH